MRIEKISILNEVIERVKDSDFCFILNYGGLKVTQLTALRQELAKHGARAMVVKNTYLGRVAKEQGWADVSGMLTGPTARITGRGDVAEVAKAAGDKMLEYQLHRLELAGLIELEGERIILTEAGVAYGQLVKMEKELGGADKI